MGNEHSKNRKSSQNKMIVPKLQYIPNDNNEKHNQQNTNSSTLKSITLSKTPSTITPLSPPSNTNNQQLQSDDNSHNMQDDQKKCINTITARNINNGVTGYYLSVAIAETVYIFWKKNLQQANEKKKLVSFTNIYFVINSVLSVFRLFLIVHILKEIGCNIYFTMIDSNNEIKEIFKNYLKHSTIEKLSIRRVTIIILLLAMIIVTSLWGNRS